MSYTIAKGKCPACAKYGKDRAGDNLAIYSDGHQFCFACGYYLPGDPLHSLKETPVTTTKTDFSLPDDVEPALAGLGWTWLNKYGITPTEVYKYKVLWSEKLQWLIFPYFTDNELICWQARNFNTNKPYKYLTRGNPADTLWVYNHSKKQIVLVEDVVSAIKCNRIMDSMPILGSVISNLTLTRLKRYYDTLFIWLDPDKHKEAIKFSQTAQLFNFKVTTILSDKDPKDYSNEEINQKLLSRLIT